MSDKETIPEWSSFTEGRSSVWETLKTLELWRIKVDLVEKQQEIKRKSMLERERRREIEDDSRFRKRRRKFTPEEKAILLEHFSGLNDYRERNGLSRWITIAEVLTYVPVLRADFCSHCHKSAEAIEYITNGGEHTICLSCGHKRFYSCL